MQNTYADERQQPWWGAARATAGATQGLGGELPEEAARDPSQFGATGWSPNFGGGGMAPFLGGLGALFGSGGGGDEYGGQIQDILQKYFSPYQQMVSDPGALMSKFGAGFKASPGYQYQLQQALGAGGRAAAEGGMAGSPAEQFEAEKAAQGLSSQDYGKYMQNILGLYGQGARGYGQMGEDLVSNLMRQQDLERAQGAQQGMGAGEAMAGLASILGFI